MHTSSFSKLAFELHLSSHSFYLEGGTMNNYWVVAFLCTLIVLILALAWFYPMTSFSRTEIRAAIDIGSGATNIKIAKVDPKTNQIISQLFEQSIPVPYQKHLEQSSDQTFDQEVMNQGIKAIQVLKETADKYNVKKVIAVATAAFRNAKNAPAFVEEIEKRTGVKVLIIDQDQEGILAFQGAIAKSGAPPHDVIVWDIGGGSVQLTVTETDSGQFIVEKGKLASIPFKNALIRIQNKDPQQVESPNPVSREDMQKAMAFIEEQVAGTNPYIMKKVQHPNAQVLAVGSLFNFGIKPVAGGAEVVTQEALEKGIEPLLDKTDEQLNQGSLTEIAVSNPVLILGYMKAWDIPQVKIISVNNADGALVYPEYWQN
jgi:exopolyphosphatase / guanosine-5'-triphosphate,3'-diphosphate pyrophosphatase